MCFGMVYIFKETMKSSFKTNNFHDLILKLVTDESLYAHYPVLSLLAEIASAFPASTSEIEKGFQLLELYQV